MRIQRDGKPWWNFPAWKSGMKENRGGMWIALSECPGTGYTLSQSQYSRWPGCVLCAVYLDWSVVVVVWWLDALTDWLVSWCASVSLSLYTMSQHSCPLATGPRLRPAQWRQARALRESQQLGHCHHSHLQGARFEFNNHQSSDFWL